MNRAPRPLRRVWRRFALRVGPRTAAVASTALALLGLIAFTVLAANVAVTASNATQDAPGLAGRPAITGVTPTITDLSIMFDAPGYAGTSPISTYEYSTDDGGTWSGRATGTTGSPLVVTTTSSTGTALAPDTAYAVRIRAVNGVGVGFASNAVATRTLPDRPGPPSEVTATASTTTIGKVELAWTAPTSGTTPTAYDVRWSTSSSMTDATTTDSATVTTAYSARSLEPGTAYWFQVRSRADTTTSDWTPTTPVTATPAPVPSTPEDVTALQGDSSTLLTWTAPTSGPTPTAYDVRVSTSSSMTGATITTSATTTTNYTYSGLTNGITYWFQVRSRVDGIRGSWAPPTPVSAVPSTVPNPPTSVVAAAGNSAVTATWTAPVFGTAPSTYDVRWSTSSSMTDATTITSATSGTAYVVAGLTAGTTYWVQVRSRSAIDELSGWSPTDAVSAVPYTTPPTPTDVATLEYGGADGRITARVPTVTDGSTAAGSTTVSGYTVTFSPGGATCTAGQSANATTTCTVTGLTSGTEYTATYVITTSTSPALSSAASPASNGFFAPGCGVATAAFGSGLGTAISPYEVATTAQLARIATGFETCHFAQTADISVSSIANWTPIGTWSRPFTASYDGNGHTISGLTVDRSGEDGVGLFGVVEGATSTNRAVIRELRVAGTVTGASSVGGVVGDAMNLTITDVRSTVTVTGSMWTGGLVGSAITIGIGQSASTGAVTGSDTTGGLVGDLSSSGTMAEETSTISTSWSTGAVAGGDYSGGLVGSATLSTVSDSWARGSVTGTGVGSGGLVGFAAALTTVTRSFSAGAAVAGSDAGGLVGILSPDGAVVTGSFWDTTASGNATSPAGTGRTTAQMTTLSTFTGASWSIAAGYDASKTWGLCAPVNAGYPYLTSTYTSSPCPPDAPTSITATAGDASVLLSWTAPASGTTPTAYDVRVSTSSTMTSATTTESATATTSYTVTGLTNSTAYWFQVRSRNASGTSDWSPASPVTATPVAPPNAPTSISASARAESALLSWTAPASGTTPTAYDVRVSTSSSMTSATTTESATATTSYTVTGLTNGTKYYFQVRPRAGSSVGSWSPATPVSATPAPAPAAPTSVSCSAADTTQVVGTISCTFTAPSGTITKYQYTTDGGTTWADATGTTSPIKLTAQSDGQPLLDGYAYTAIKLRAVNAMGTGTASSASASVTPSGVPDALFDMRTTATPLATSAALAYRTPGDYYLSAPTDSGSISTPDNSGLDTVASIWALVALDDWTPSSDQTIASKRSSDAGSDTAWVFEVTTEGKLRFTVGNGSTLLSGTSTVAVSVADGAPLYIRVARSATAFTFSTSLDPTASTVASFTTLGTSVTISGLSASNDVTAPMYLGTNHTSASNRLAGKIYKASARTGTTVVANFDNSKISAVSNADTTITTGTGMVGIKDWTVTMGTTGAKRARAVSTLGGLTLTKYRLTVSPAVSGTSTFDNGSNLTYSLTGLTANTGYTVTAAAVNSNGAGTASNQLSFTTAAS